jgi:putative phosphoribosyl transferase
LQQAGLPDAIDLVIARHAGYAGGDRGRDLIAIKAPSGIWCHFVLLSCGPSAVGNAAMEIRDVHIPPLGLAGSLSVPRSAHGLVVFAHGSGSSRLSPRNVAVAEALNGRGMATLLFDLLTADEEADRSNVFDIPLLARRLDDVVHWIASNPIAKALPLGLFGASTGAAAAIVAAASLGDRVRAIVSRGGRPDLAGTALERVRAPTLLIVGGADYGVIELNEMALARLKGDKAIEIVPGATHLFPEPGAMEAVIEHAARWFDRYLATDHSDKRAHSASSR